MFLLLLDRSPHLSCPACLVLWRVLSHIPLAAAANCRMLTRRDSLYGAGALGVYESSVMANGTSVYRAGMAVAPVTDWRFYDTIYTGAFRAVRDVLFVCVWLIEVAVSGNE